MRKRKDEAVETEEDKKWYQTEMARLEYQKAEREKKIKEWLRLRGPTRPWLSGDEERDRKLKRLEKIKRLMYWAFILAWASYMAWLLIESEIRQSACEETCNTSNHWNGACLCADEDGRIYLQSPDE